MGATGRIAHEIEPQAAKALLIIRISATMNVFAGRCIEFLTWKGYSARQRAHVWFYKKGCQEKKLPRELEAAKSFGIQPLQYI